MPDIFINEPKKEEPSQEEVKPVEQHGERKAQKSHHRHSSSLPPESEGREPGLFTAYCPHPKGLKFINQEPDEELLLFLRRHFITNVPWIIFTVLLLFLPPVIYVLFHSSLATLFTIPPRFVFIFTTFYYLVVLTYALGKFIIWFYHVGVVTPKRLMDLDVDNVFHYHHSETELRDVVDVSYIQRGFFQSFFNYGTVHIQTEAIKANFEYEDAPNASKIADIVTDLRPQLKGAEHES